MGKCFHIVGDDQVKLAVIQLINDVLVVMKNTVSNGVEFRQ